MLKYLLAFILVTSSSLAMAGIDNLISPTTFASCDKDEVGINIISDSSIPDSQCITVVEHDYYVVGGTHIPVEPESYCIGYSGYSDSCAEIVGLNMYHVQAVGTYLTYHNTEIPNCASSVSKPAAGWSAIGGYTGLLRISKTAQGNYVCHKTL